MKTIDFLCEHNACEEGATWALSIGDDMAEVWDALIKEGKHEWLIWAATRPGVFSDAVLRKLACRFVRETPLADGRLVWDLLTDERSRNAVAVAERYADGKATGDELKAARDVAHEAARAACAAYTAALTAANAAAYEAADAAADAAVYAAANTAYVSYAAARAAYVSNTAYDAANAAYAAANTAYDDYASANAVANAAQIKMVAELDNPFRSERSVK